MKRRVAVLLGVYVVLSEIAVIILALELWHCQDRMLHFEFENLILKEHIQMMRHPPPIKSDPRPASTTNPVLQERTHK